MDLARSRHDPRLMRSMKFRVRLGSVGNPAEEFTEFTVVADAMP
jgi:hypothetical protein